MRTLPQTNRNGANQDRSAGRSECGLPQPLPRTITPRLLVSVRNRSEIDDALAAEVDIVDLKEPQQGALAPASARLWRQTAARWPLRQQHTAATMPLLSAALGESSQASRLARLLPSQFSFAKAGPRGCSRLGQIRRLWSTLRDQLDDQIELVAVAYADFEQAECLSPEAVFQAASDAGIGRCLIDTWCKNGRSTLDHLGIDGLTRLNEIAASENLWWALAGSLRAADAASLIHRGLMPNCFGVRGDVCQGDRTGALSRGRIEDWKSALTAKGSSDSWCP